MITISLNGERRSFEKSLNVLELLRQLSISSQAVAVAVNQHIVPRSEFETRALENDDRIEIIRAVGGG